MTDIIDYHNDSTMEVINGDLRIRMDYRLGEITIGHGDWFKWDWDAKQVKMAPNLIHFVEPGGDVVGVKISGRE